MRRRGEEGREVEASGGILVNKLVGCLWAWRLGLSGVHFWTMGSVTGAGAF